MGIASKVVGQRPSPIFKGIRARRESDSAPLPFVEFAP